MFSLSPRRLISFLSLSFLFLSVTPALALYYYGTFTEISGPSPSARYAHGMALLNSHTIALFGGGVSFPTDTWTFDGSQWTQAAPAHHPAGRWSFAMFPAGPDANTVVLYGGEVNGQFFSDTWFFDGTDWTQSPGSSPPGRNAQGSVYADQDGHGYVFGGWNGGAYLSDLWKFDGASWASLGIGSGLQRTGHSLFEWNDGLLLYGGETNAQATDTFARYDFSTQVWTYLQDARPSPRQGMAFAVQPVEGYLVMYGGGTAASGAINDQLWLYDGTWNQVHYANGPGPLQAARMVWLPSTGKFYLNGGRTPGGLSASTWSLEILATDITPTPTATGTPSPLPTFTPTVTPTLPPTSTPTDTFTPRPTSIPQGPQSYHAAFRQLNISGPSARFGDDTALLNDHTVLLFGGGPSPHILNDTWTFDGTQWTQLQPQVSPPARWSHTLFSLGPDSNAVMLFGGRNANTPYFEDTWKFSQGSWTQQVAVGPSGRFTTAIQHTDHTGGLLFGGWRDEYLGDFWRFDGLQWDKIGDYYALRRVGECLFMFDGAPYMFGGETDSYRAIGDTQRFDEGSGAWVDLGLNGPSDRGAMAFASPESAEYVVGYGGAPQNLQPPYGDLWIFDGLWHPVPFEDGPPALALKRLMYLPSTGKFYLFGGRLDANQTPYGETWELEISPSSDTPTPTPSATPLPTFTPTPVPADTNTPLPTPTLQLTPVPTPQNVPHNILVAGYNDTSLTYANGGTLSITVLTPPLALSPYDEVELYYIGSPTGIMVPRISSGVFQLMADIPERLIPSRSLFELAGRNTANGKETNLWPYFTVHP